MHPTVKLKKQHRYASAVTVFVGLLFLVPLYSDADMRDPTKPNMPVVTETQQAVAEENLTLSAIWRTSKHRRATINGITVKEGEAVSATITLIHVGRNEVTVKQNGKLKTLTLSPSSQTQATPTATNK